MIRHHVAQDLLSADATSIYPVMGVAATTPTAALSGHTALDNSSRGGDGLTWNHPFAFYAAPVSTMFLLVVSIIALLELTRVRRARVTHRPEACIVAGLPEQQDAVRLQRNLLAHGS